ncbi:hypothetical protein KFE25_004781 [Diacronema lutheri]|uniref:S1 motif domain-containing protein n=2 Tax=Diacronema lutheri TaxID=2081491 RepID=A0A8J5XPV4_DIALT|nr:hypothetical protein KFE25_004781 [Diacronema lutheri]
MYEAKFPEVDECVMVQVRSIAEMGAYVSLLEYDNIEGMILLSELSRRRIRSINKLIRVGKQEVCMVLRVDKEKGYIDLSKRRVSAEDITQCDERFTKAKAVHSIMRHLADQCAVEMIDLYPRIAWPLYKRFGHAFDAFKLSISDSKGVWSTPGIDVDEQTARLLADNILKRLTPQAVKIRADLEVTCFEYEGIEAIQRSLAKGALCSTADAPVRVRLVAPPLYVALTQAMEKDVGIAVLEKAIEAIGAEIRAAKGELVVKVKPRAISAQDEKLLNSLMETLERQNEEVGGDSDGEGEVTGMGNLKIDE